MAQPLTNEIAESDELFRRWLYGELYDALQEAGYFDEEDKALAEWEQIVLYGTGEGEPVGILHAS
jgi:hypothetical protein